MIWTKLSIETTTAAVDMLSYELGELGIEGIEIADHVPLSEDDKKAMYIDILPELPEDDGTAVVSCYIDDPLVDVETLVEDIHKVLEEMAAYIPIGSGRILVGKTEDKDWINNWKEFFKPFRLEDSIVIKPTWITSVDTKEDDIVIEIDPGTAFGTGSHQTTKLCIAQIKKYLTSEKRVLDLGCGSGILAIISCKLGAKEAFGIDIDENAIVASKENYQVNHIAKEKISFERGDVIGDPEFVAKIQQEKGTYDIVVANILADVIVPLSAKVAPLISENGIFITSGIIQTKEEEVRNALLANGFEIKETTYMGEWVSFTATCK